MLLRASMVAVTFAFAGPAFAVDFGVMETADVVETGKLKFAAHPLSIGDDNSLRDEGTGMALGLGYGFRPNFDAEAQVAIYDDITWFGGDLEYTLYDDWNVELSIGSGAHYGDSDYGNPWGLDLTHIASYKLPAAPRVKLNGGVDIAYEDVEARFASLRGIDGEYFTAHFVPGVQLAATRHLDLIAEFGAPLNGEASEYVAAGLSYYFDGRRY